MTLYIDGDAFPNMLKPILLRAVELLDQTGQMPGGDFWI